MLLGIKWYQFVRNDDIRRRMKQPKLTAIIQSHRLTLFGHIMRMDDNADAKRILLASPPADWRRQLGRPTSRGSAPSNRIWNNTTLCSQKQQIWPRTALRGGWCWHMALRKPELHARNDDVSGGCVNIDIGTMSGFSSKVEFSCKIATRWYYQKWNSNSERVVKFLSTFSDKTSCITSTALQNSIVQFVSDSWASCINSYNDCKYVTICLSVMSLPQLRNCSLFWNSAYCNDNVCRARTPTNREHHKRRSRHWIVSVDAAACEAEHRWGDSIITGAAEQITDDKSVA